MFTLPFSQESKRLFLEGGESDAVKKVIQTIDTEQKLKDAHDENTDQNPDEKFDPVKDKEEVLNRLQRIHDIMKPQAGTKAERLLNFLREDVTKLTENLETAQSFLSMLQVLNASLENPELKDPIEKHEKLTEKEQSLLDKATQGKLENALINENKEGFYAIEFADDLYVLMNADGEGMMVNEAGLKQFAKNEAISEENIAYIYAPEVSGVDIAIDIFKKVPLPIFGLHPLGLGLAIGVEATSYAVSYIMDKTDTKIPLEWNPLYHLSKLFENEPSKINIDDLVNTLEKAKEKRQYKMIARHFPPVIENALIENPNQIRAVLQSYLSALENNPEKVMQALKDLDKSTKDEDSTAVRELFSTLIVQVQNQSVSHAKTTLSEEHQGLELGTTQRMNGLMFSTQAGFSTARVEDTYRDVISKSRGYGTSLAFSADTGKDSGFTGLEAQTGFLFTQRGKTYQAQEAGKKYQIEHPSTQYIEQTLSPVFRIKETGTKITPVLGVGAAFKSGNFMGAESVLGIGAEQPLDFLDNPLISNIRLTGGVRKSLDSTQVLSIGGDIAGKLPISVSLLNKGAPVIYPFKLFDSDVSPKDMELMSNQLASIYARTIELATLLESPESEERSDILNDVLGKLDQYVKEFKDLPDEILEAISSLTQAVNIGSIMTMKKEVIRAYMTQFAKLIKGGKEYLESKAINKNALIDFTTRTPALGNKMYQKGRTETELISPPEAVDTTPNDFTPDAGGVDVNSVAVGAEVTWTFTVTGINAATAISVGGHATTQYRINGGAYTNAAGTVMNGQTVTIRHTSGADTETRNSSITVGGVTKNVSSTASTI